MTSALGLGTACALYGQFWSSDPAPATSASADVREDPSRLISRIDRMVKGGASVKSAVPLAVDAFRNLDHSGASAHETGLAHSRLAKVSEDLVREERVCVAHLIALTHALKREERFLPIHSCRPLLRVSDRTLTNESNRHVFEETVVNLARLNDSKEWHQEIISACRNLSRERMKIAKSAVERVSRVQRL